MGCKIMDTLSWERHKDGTTFRTHSKFAVPSTNDSILHLYKFTICQLYMVWCFSHFSCNSDKIQRRLRHLFGENLFRKLQTLSSCHNAISLALFYRYFNGHCSNKLESLKPDRYLESYFDVNLNATIFFVGTAQP